MESPERMDHLRAPTAINRSIPKKSPVASLQRDHGLDAALPARSGNGAFTLVETVLAVAIVAFALVAILGLVGLAVQGTKDSDVATRVAMVNRRVVSDLQSRTFAAVTGSFAAKSTQTSYYDLYGTPYTDSFGNPRSPVPGTSGTYFECDVTNATPSSPAPVLSSTNNAALLRIVIRWPYPQLTGSDVSVSSIANYQ